MTTHFSKLIVGKTYNVIPSEEDLDESFEAVILEKMNATKSVKVHYKGFPPEFDEIIVASEANVAEIEEDTHWRNILKVGDVVDTFLEEINRWERLKVAEVSPDKKQIKLGSVNSPLIAVTSELLSEEGSRTKNDECAYPCSVNKAGEIANTMLGITAKKACGIQICEELARSRTFHSADCLTLFTRMERGQIYPKNTIEGIRYCDAKAAMMLEAAFSTKTGDEQLVTGAVSYHNTALLANVGWDENENNAPQSEPASMDANAFMRYSVPFRDALHDDWSTLNAKIKERLDLADILETKALASNSIVLRRTLFADAASLIEKVVTSTYNRNVRYVCHWRISLHYINGLGVDTTELPSQEAADIQASEYLDRAKVAHYAKGMLGISATLGRANVGLLTNIPQTCAAVTKLLTDATTAGNMAAVCWHAKILYEGWGDQTCGAVRLAALTEAKRLFTLCDELQFNVKESKRTCIHITELVASTSPDKDKCWYLLALYVFTVHLKTALSTRFLPLLLQSVKTFAQTQTLPGVATVTDAQALPTPPPVAGSVTPKPPTPPPVGPVTPVVPVQLRTPQGAQDSINAEWLTHLRDMTLYSAAFEQTSGVTAAQKSDAAPVDDKAAAVTSTQQMVRMQMRQAFNLFEEATSGHVAWTMDHIQAFEPLLRATVMKARKLCDDYRGGEVPAVEAAARSLAAGLQNMGEVELWNLSLMHAKIAYESVSPLQRQFSTQCAVMDSMLHILKSEDKITSAMKACNIVVEPGEAVATSVVALEAVAKVVKLARFLASISREVEPDIAGKHVRSAEALLLFSHQKGITVEAAMHILDSEANITLLGSFACEYPSRVGYHTLIDAKHVSDYLAAGAQNQAGRLTEKNATFLAANPDINNGWRGGSDKSLLNIFEECRALVATKTASDKLTNDALSTPQPLIKLEAMMYADPWAITHIDVDRALEHHFDHLQEVMAGIGGTEADAVQGILNDCLAEKFKLLGLANSPVLGKVQGATKQSARIEAMKKLLFLLENSPDMNWNSAEKKVVLAATIQESMGSRCIDGINSFCDSFVTELTLQQNVREMSVLPPVISRLILNISSLVQRMKMKFIKSHLSRVKTGHEARTVGSVLLNSMLMLPLGLIGNYSILRHPSFGTNDQSNATQLDSGNVVRRYIMGGTIDFTYGDHVEFPELTVKSLAYALKKSIVISENGSEKAEPNDNPLLESRPWLGFTIDETVVENFCLQDVLICRHYMSTRLNGYTSENLFFKALPEEVTDNQPQIVRIMKDSVLVRMLHVAQYVTVSPVFWHNLKNNWSFESGV